MTHIFSDIDTPYLMTALTVEPGTHPSYHRVRGEAHISPNGENETGFVTLTNEDSYRK